MGMIIMRSFSSSALLFLAVLAVYPLADNSALYPRSDSGYRELSHLSFSRCQLLVGDATASRCKHETIEPLQGMELYITEIEPERELINVTPQMLFARVVVDTTDAAFENRPDAFYRVRVSHSTAVFAKGMVNRLVGKEQATDAVVGRELVRAKRRADGNVIVNGLLKRRQIGRVNGHRFGATTTLTESENGLLTDRPATEIQLLVGVFRGFLTADIGFVNLDNALQFVDVRTASLTEPLKHKPSRLLGNAYLLAQLERRDALTGRNEQIHRIYPLVKRDVRTLKDRASPNRENELRTGVASILTVFTDGDAFAGLTGRANNAVRPESGFEIEPRSLGVGNEFKQLKGRYGAFAHRPKLAKLCGVVKYIIPFIKGGSR
jgi:hypothetical protein